MIDHLELSVVDLLRSETFFRRALGPLGYQLRVSNELRGFGVEMNSLDFWLRGDGASTPRPHFAFNCATRALVNNAYEAAIAAGGTDNGQPKLMAHIHANYYAGFVRDPDGHNIEFVCHAPGK